jgi:hypothetical protein
MPHAPQARDPRLLVREERCEETDLLDRHAGKFFDVFGRVGRQRGLVLLERHRRAVESLRIGVLAERAVFLHEF